MEVIKPSDLRRIISDVVVDMNEPVMVVGQFGGGKSEITNEVVKELGAFPCDIRLGQYESVDLHGIPAKSKDNLLVWFPPSTLPFVGNPHFPDDQTIVLILDEITSATPPVFAVAYQLINERRVGEHYLKDNVRIIAHAAVQSHDVVRTRDQCRGMVRVGANSRRAESHHRVPDVAEEHALHL